MQHTIQTLFSNHGDALADVTRSAKQAEILIEAISPIIEAFTSSVCPDCTSVCCIDRHSRFDYGDLIFMSSLGKDIPERNSGIPDTGACRFLGSIGCARKRSERPYRCTWFFCSALLDQINRQASAAEQRKFIKMLKDITTCRMAMINDFETVTMNLFSARIIP